jgi:uncharacterized protein YPO0396
MMSRQIELTRIHAINWYGYRDSIDVRGNLLIAGITGSGKSVLMDLLQLGLVGDRSARYNQSATGSASTRSLKGYCLGDTKQDLEGAPQYMRDKGSITYVALEFTWPDRKRVETWGLRIEFDSAAREEPNSKRGFYIPESLERAGFLTSDKQPLDSASFRRLVRDQGGEIFDTMEVYRREMALPSHLNFDRSTLDYLLPAAMSFSFLRSFSAFCRQYILPSDEVNIAHVKDSYQAFRNLERDLGLLRDQQVLLERIQMLDREHTAAVRDRVVARYLEAEFLYQHFQEELNRANEEYQSLEKEFWAETQRLGTVEKDISNLREQVESLKTVLRESEEGRLFLDLKSRIQKRVTLLQRLREIGTNVMEALQGRCKSARLWLRDVEALPFRIETTWLEPVAFAVSQAEQASSSQIRERIRALADAVQAASRAITSAGRSVMDQFLALQNEQTRLQQTLSVLALGTLPENTVLLSVLNSRLPKIGGTGKASALWQLCEVTDERWRPAIEIAFTRKFAVVVEPADYDLAEKIYHELREEARGESLVNPLQALSQQCAVRAGSLAEKIEASHPIAQAIVSQLFGDLMCVESIEDLRKHNRAILPDGFMATRPFVERRRRYDNRPCVGKRGIEKQRAFLQEHLSQNLAAQKQLSPTVNALRELSDLVRERRLDSESLHDDLAEAVRLPEVEAEQAADLAKLNTIRDTVLEEKETTLVALENALRALETEQKNLLSSQNRGLLEQKRQHREAVFSRLENAKFGFQQVTAETDVSLYLERLKEMRDEMGQQYPVREVASRQCQNAYHDARVRAQEKRDSLLRERRELALKHIVFQEFDVEVEINEAYDQRLEKIRSGDIPTYEQKARSEQLNWQNLFRTQVLEKLRAALARVEDLINLLNTQLRRYEIGNDRYQIHRTPNADHEYKIYRELIATSALANENELFFASASEEVKETVETLFQKLIDQPESREALAFLDYRNYHDYDMWVYDIRDAQASPSSVDRHSGKFSGGENQSPYFVAILACYLRAYRRYERTRRDPALALVPIDEAFSKLSGERIRDCIRTLQDLDLQGVFSMSSGNIPYAIDMCDQVITVSKREKTVGRRTTIRNIPVTLTRKEALDYFANRS